MYFFKKTCFQFLFPPSFCIFLFFLPFSLFLTTFELNLLKQKISSISAVASENSQTSLNSLNAGEHTVCDGLGLSLINAGSSVAKDEKKYIFTQQLHELYGLLSKYHSKSW